jgi:3-hydroxyacyl-CoA dehydrogenase
LFENTTVVGAGVMGAEIAQSLAVGGYHVSMFDLSTDQLERAMERIENGRYGLRAGVRKGKLDAAAAEEALERVTVVEDLERACAHTDLVIEAVPEKIDLKIQVFRELDRLCPPHAILASNTAGLPIAALAAATNRPEQVVGWHWSQPIAVMPFAEIIVHEHGSGATTDAIVEAARRCGKNPIVVNDQPLVWGFVVNRVQAAIWRECREIVDEGVATRDDVDQLLKDCLRWPMGPFEMQEFAKNGFEQTTR